MNDNQALQQRQDQLNFQTNGPGFLEITRDVQNWLARQSVDRGLLTLFLQHTSASLTIQENADPDVLRDLVDSLDGLAPESSHYRHNSEGADDMPAHIKAMLTSSSLNIPVHNGAMALGTWQGLYLIEHRANRKDRHLVLHFSGTIQGRN